MLKKILSVKKDEIELAKKQKPLSLLKDLVSAQSSPKDLGIALLRFSNMPVRIIAECKKKSPSRGLLTENYQPTSQALTYERAGAAAISVLTDEIFFGGSLNDLESVCDAVKIPVLRKDFIIDEYQIWQSRAKGADSFLLIASLLDVPSLQYLIEVGRELNMEPLVETHSQHDLDIALQTDAKIIGVNNRNLDTFAIDLNHSINLAKELKKNGSGRIIVCESGISSHADIKTMQEAGYCAFLIGELLMQSKNPAQTLNHLLYGAAAI